MPTIPVHLSSTLPPSPYPNPLPSLLHTPSGLALIELQGTLNIPPPLDENDTTQDIGKIVFSNLPDDKTVWLYIGQHQRMTGEMKKLTTPMGVMRRREKEDVDMDAGEKDPDNKWDGEELEIVEVVYWKVVFSGRPEPVGASAS